MKPNNDFLNEDGTKEAIEKMNAKGKGKSNSTEQPLGEQLKVKRLAQKDFITTELKKFNLADAVIEEWKNEYMELKVVDMSDKDTIEKATTAYKLVKNTRIAVENKRKDLKADSLAFGRAVDNEAKRLTEALEPLEAHLEAQKNFIELEKEKIRKEREEKQKARMTERTNKLLTFGMIYNGETFELIEGEEKLSLSSLDAKMLDDNAFNIVLLKAEILHEKRKIRTEQEQEDARKEKERLEALQAEQKKEAERLEKIKAEQEAAAKKIEEEKAALEEQKKELERQKQKDKEIAEASAKAAKEAEEKAAKEKEEALRVAEEKRLADIAAIEKANKEKEGAELKAKAEAEAKKKEEEAQLAKEEALKPDKIRIHDFAKFLSGLKLPELVTEEGKIALETIKSQHAAYIKWLNNLSEKLK